MSIQRRMSRNKIVSEFIMCLFGSPANWREKSRKKNCQLIFLSILRTQFSKNKFSSNSKFFLHSEIDSSLKDCLTFASIFKYFKNITHIANELLLYKNRGIDLIVDFKNTFKIDLPCFGFGAKMSQLFCFQLFFMSVSLTRNLKLIQINSG